MPPAIDLTGKKFGMLTVIKRVKNNKWKKSVWFCKCECGTEKNIIAGDLVKGATKSCGCLSAKMAKDRLTTHGYSNHSLYAVWSSMTSRCRNENDKQYVDYGGRGISICKEWYKPEVFIKWALESGWKSGLQIDRIDNDGGYCPENCRLASPKENSNNSRPLRRDNTTGFTGVFFRKHEEKYASYIAGNDEVFKGKKLRHLGYYNTPEEAAEARDRFIIENNLPYRKLQILKRP